MSHDSFQQFTASLRHWIAFVGARRLAGSIAGCVVAIGAGWFVLRPSSTPVELSLPSITTAVIEASGQDVHVHVVGAVKNPGVYTLPSSARVIDAVTAAGGSLRSADLEGINMAQTLMDSEQVFIPSRRASRPRTTVAPRLKPRPRITSTTVAAGTPTARIININTATAQQLESLTGVGPATAKAIISYRSTKGPFTKVEDLLNVPGIGPAKLLAMRNEISVS